MTYLNSHPGQENRHHSTFFFRVLFQLSHNLASKTKTIRALIIQASTTNFHFHLRQENRHHSTSFLRVSCQLGHHDVSTTKTVSSIGTVKRRDLVLLSLGLQHEQHEKLGSDEHDTAPNGANRGASPPMYFWDGLAL